MSLDLSTILEDWPYEPGKISVRKIVGDDGRPKIQLRLDLGMLQMEVQGRPDGERPHGFESYLEFYEDRLRLHRDQYGREEGFSLSPEDCQLLRSESVMYYHRYLSEFALEEFDAVERDTARNLRVMDLCRRFAQTGPDKVTLEQYRPYVVMMHTRARALQAIARDDYRAARQAVMEGMDTLRVFMESPEADLLSEGRGELTVLETLLDEIDRQRPMDPIETLERSLAEAIEQERYEDAAVLRDRLSAMRRDDE